MSLACDRPRRLACLVLILLLATAGAAEDRPAKPPTAAEIDKLIRQLGSDDFDAREAATKRLAELGEVVWRPLRKALAQSDDQEVRSRARQLLDRLNGRLFGELRQLTGHTAQVDMLALSGDGKRLLSGSQDATLRLWDVETGKELLCLRDQPGGVWCVALTRDGRRALSGAGMVHDGRQWVTGSDHAVRLWDLEAGKEVRRFEGHTSELRCLVFSPDERRFLSAGWDKVVRLWDVESGKEVRRFEGHTNSIRSVAFSPDGRRFLSTSRDKTVRLWDVETGKELRRFEGHAEDVFCAAFTPDGKRALSGGADATLRLWDLDTGKEVRKFEGHATLIWNVALTPDGRYALSAAGCRRKPDGFYEPAEMDYALRLWDVQTGEEVAVLEGPTSSTMSVLFTADGRRAISTGSDRTIRVWKVNVPRE
jgi:WD40 repeat protein